MKKRLVSLLLIACVLASALPTLAAGIPADISGAACESAVVALVEAGILKGYPDGAFRPDQPMTRAEAVVMVGERIHMFTKDAVAYADTAGHWAAHSIARADEIGLLRGYSDGTFRPNDAVTYGDFVTMALRTLFYTEKMLDGTGFWGKALELGLITEAHDPNAPILRGDAAILFAAVLAMELEVPVGANLSSTMEALAVLQGDELVRGFVLAGSVTQGSINGLAVSEDARVYLWDSVPGMWGVEADAELLYRYVALYAPNADGAATVVFAVDRADAPGYWDASATGGDDFANAYNIPYGQRQLDLGIGGAADDYSNLVTSGDLENSTYWPTYDWMASTSTSSLTYLTGFKTSQQTTGWACGTTSALMALEWYGLRGDLNELDLSTLRNKLDADGQFVWGGYTDTQMLVSMFENLNKMAGSDVWAWESVYDFADGDDFDFDTYLTTDWIKGHLSQGHPILVGWNSFGGHWQVIIGYDDMGTEATADDVLILADPYDTTDHLNDGYNIQSYERLYYDYTQDFDRDFGMSQGYGFPVAFVPYPAEGFDWQPVMGDGLATAKGDVWHGQGNRSDDMLIPYGTTADDLAASSYTYSLEQRGENGLAGPASSDWHRGADVDGSPYYLSVDFYVDQPDAISPTLSLLPQFKTAQQASEWTCGPATLRMALNHYGMENLPSEFALAGMRQNDIEGATTLDGMTQMLEGLNAQGGDYAWLSSDDLDDDWNIGGTQHNLEGGFVPWCIRHGIPVIIGWDEWGGHWMAIIGYDDMGTEATQDDVIILADPYDTTDHCQDGYVVESWERLIYGWGAAFDDRGSELFLVFAPQGQMENLGLLAQ